jgi:hypothetical protein
MIIGYALDFPDIKCDMLGNYDAGNCSRYKNIYDLNVLNPKFKLKKNKYSISCTYDGFVIVTVKFKHFCEKNNYRGLDFIPLISETEYYWFKICNVWNSTRNNAGRNF